MGALRHPSRNQGPRGLGCRGRRLGCEMGEATRDVGETQRPSGRGEDAVGGVADLCERLRADWLRGERVPAEEYLRRAPALQADADAALDLIYTELVVREELGERPEAEELLGRFPQYRTRLERQLALDRA